MKHRISKSPGGYLARRSHDLRRAMTPAESVFWENVRGSRLGGLKFRRQQVLGEMIVDFYCHSARLAIELDGAVHELQQGRDALRDLGLEKLGVRVIRFANDDVTYRLDWVLASVLAVARAQDSQQTGAPN